ncbi:hypothetical protein GQ457_05G015900 [Hibiscus cannabinus]
MLVCIDEEQAGFVPGRQILDNILVAHELFHYMQSSRNGPNKGATLKLDIEKAYDRVEWAFLQTVMLKLGFNSKWVELIMRCIITVSYQVRLNCALSDVIVPTRGIQQGDHLSPFLFLFCTHGLSAFLHKAQTQGSIRGIRASRNGPRITHCWDGDPHNQKCFQVVEKWIFWWN